MTRVEALEFIGASGHESGEEIKKKFKMWALKNHPDHGGNALLFSKVLLALGDKMFDNREILVRIRF